MRWDYFLGMRIYARCNAAFVEKEFATSDRGRIRILCEFNPGSEAHTNQ